MRPRERDRTLPYVRSPSRRPVAQGGCISIGAPEQLAAHVIAWQDAGAVDGFTFMGSTLPHELKAFVDHVVPILQRCGRFRTEYTGHTLRDHLGLQRPSK